MYEELDDDPFLAPETTVSLQFDTDSDDSEDWSMDDSDALAQAETGAWERHAGSNRFGSSPFAFDSGNDDRPMTLREAIRLVMELP
jgi:hypothetical protein